MSIYSIPPTTLAMTRLTSALALVAVLPLLASARTIKFGAKVRARFCGGKGGRY
jgi:hypothetical protein